MPGDEAALYKFDTNSKILEINNNTNYISS